MRALRKSSFPILVAAVLSGSTAVLEAQVVTVTLRADTNTIAVGTSTTLHAFAQIVPAKQSTTDRIFSWYVDLLNSSASVAAINAPQLAKPTSDEDPRTSSSGFVDGSNLRGIYDTFINLANAGRTNPVELFSVPIVGVTPGQTTFRLQAGTGAPGLAADFIVAPAGGGDPLLGGDYSAATVTIAVSAGNGLRLTIAREPLSPLVQRLHLTFPTTAGKNYQVEYRDSLTSGPDWQPLPGAPHNSGAVVDTNSLAMRFYRLRSGP